MIKLLSNSAMPAISLLSMAKTLEDDVTRKATNTDSKIDFISLKPLVWSFRLLLRSIFHTWVVYQFAYCKEARVFPLLHTRRPLFRQQEYRLNKQLDELLPDHRSSCFISLDYDSLHHLPASNIGNSIPGNFTRYST